MKDNKILNKDINCNDLILFRMYCIFVFLSQFDYIFSFTLFGQSIPPVKIFMVILIICDLKINNFKIKIINSKNNYWLKMMGLWCIWTLISFLWAKNIMGTLSVFTIFIEGFLFSYYGQRLINNKERLLKILNVLILALSIHSLLCLIELKFGVYFFSIYTEKYILRGYPVSTFTNTNNLACYLSLMFFILLIAYSLVPKKNKCKLVYIILLIISIIINIYTHSRGSIIALAFGVASFLLLTIRNKKILGAMICIFIIVFTTITFNNNFKQKLNNILASAFTLDVNASSGTDFYRMNAYMNGIDFFKKTYGFGVSPGNVEYWMENYGTRFTNNAKPLHNWWLEILVSSGILVFCFMIVTWIKFYINIFIGYKNNSGNKKIVYSLLFGLGITFAIGCISPSSLYKIEWPWCILSLFFLIPRVIKDEK